MPSYDYRCEKCKKTFTLVTSMVDHEKQKAKCIKCGSVKVKRVLNEFFAKTVRRS